MLKRLFFIRHGQTDLNLRRIVQGSGVDAPLNATGHQQAARFFQAFGHIRFDHVYTSALTRAIESVQPFLDLGLPHTVVPGLNEISWGIWEGTRITTEENAYYHEMTTRWASGDVAHKLEGGESPLEVAARQRPFLADLLGAATPAGTYLICLHGRALRILLTQLLHFPLAEMDAFPHDNLCLYELHHTGTVAQVRRFADLEYVAAEIA